MLKCVTCCGLKNPVMSGVAPSSRIGTSTTRRVFACARYRSLVSVATGSGQMLEHVPEGHQIDRAVHGPAAVIDRLREAVEARVMTLQREPGIRFDPQPAPGLRHQGEEAAAAAADIEHRAPALEQALGGQPIDLRLGVTRLAVRSARLGEEDVHAHARSTRDFCRARSRPGTAPRATSSASEHRRIREELEVALLEDGAIAPTAADRAVADAARRCHSV